MSSFNLNLRPSRLLAAGGLLALAGGVLGGGCSDDPGVDYTTMDSFCHQVAIADCSVAAVQACYGAGPNTLDADTTACVAYRRAAERCNPLNLPYHADYAQGCVDAHTALYSTTQLDAGLISQMNTACSAVFNRGGARGAPCTADTDCKLSPDPSATLSCVIHQGKGTCQTPVQAMPGDKCTSPAAQCVQGYSCDVGGHCVADPTKGEACGPGVSCASNLRCDAASSTCQPLKGDSTSCTQASDCAGGFCIHSGSSGICSSTYTLAFLSPTCSDFNPATK